MLQKVPPDEKDPLEGVVSSEDNFLSEDENLELREQLTVRTRFSRLYLAESCQIFVEFESYRADFVPVKYETSGIIISTFTICG